MFSFQNPSICNMKVELVKNDFIDSAMREEGTLDFWETRAVCTSKC